MTDERRAQQIGRREVDLWREAQIAKAETLIERLEALVTKWTHFANRADAPADYKPYAEGHHDGESAAAQFAANELAVILAPHRQPRPALCPDCDHGIAGGRPCVTCGGTGYAEAR